MPRSVSTATTATPAAPIPPPIRPPMPRGVAQAPWHCRSTNDDPISAPAAPATRMARKARTRARTEGSAESGRSESLPRGDMAGIVDSAFVRTLIVLPTYQEAANIAHVLRRVRAAVPAARVLVVDDGSPDGTADLAAAMAEELGGVEVLRRKAKAGLGSAYRAGFAWGLEHEYEGRIEMDADLSHDPAQLPDLLRAVDDGADLAVGSRYVPGGSIPRWSWH